MKIRDIITHTLTEHGRWSLKRCASFTAFWLAIVYEFIIGAVLGYPTHEYVWDGLLIVATGLVGGSILDKKFENRAKPVPPPTTPPNENIG